MNAQRGLDLFFNLLLACSRLRDGGELRQSGHEKPDGTEKESWRRTAAPSHFFARFPNFAIPHMISDSRALCFAWSRTVVDVIKQ